MERSLEIHPTTGRQSSCSIARWLGPTGAGASATATVIVDATDSRLHLAFVEVMVILVL